MQRGPALVVPSVDVAPALHQELDHLRVLVDASLPDDTQARDPRLKPPFAAKDRLILVYLF